MKLNTKIFCIIILFSLYHYFIQNGLEKTFSQTYFNYNKVKRPLARCKNYEMSELLNCIGMPSGHAETSALFFLLLYFYGFIPFWITLIAILLFTIQRVITNMHTVSQVIVGSLLGLGYACIYKYFNLSMPGFIFVFTIGFLLTLLSIYKLDQKVNNKIPDWVDKSMYDSIKKKQNVPFYIKVGSLYINSIIQNRTFISWNQLENYLDKIIDNIKKSGIKYDAVVGIKTGGAIISDYISLKLGLPNYKIKLMGEEYNCKKNANNTIGEMLKKIFLKKQSDFTVCEGINENLEGQNVILIDEIVCSGRTMDQSYKYLKEEKNVYIIYPTCISFYNWRYKGNLHINNIINGTILIWPWGYDN